MVRLGLGSDLYNDEMWDNLLLTDPRLEKLSVNLKNFYDGKRGAANLITFDDNLLCIWDNQAQQVYCLVMRDFKLISVQNLIPTNAPLFDVDSLIMSTDGRYIALQGPRGVNIMELPRKFGPLNAYEGGKASILCRTVCLAERFFVCNQQVTVAESRWHPGSPAGSAHISILTNDDCIRIYDVSVPQICFQEIKLNDQSNGDIRYTTSKFASSLGQTAVSFDFGLAVDKRTIQGHDDFASASGTPERQASNAHPSTLIEEDSCIWPIYVLRGNGDVLLVYNDLHNTYLSKRILGPLTMRPPAEDNYGVDASSIICLECAPTLLAIATCSGMIYHCLALDNPEQSDSGTDDVDAHHPNFEIHSSTLADDLINRNSIISSSANPRLSRLFSSPPTLFVVESIELVLSLTSVTDHDDSTPLRLIKPSVNPQIYFCSHEAGIHIVNIPFLKLLKSSQFVSFDDQQSIVEHLICTKPISSSSPNCVSMCIPLGVALVQRRGYYSVGILLSSGEILTQRLSSINYKYCGQTSDSELKASLEDPVSFTIYINQILKRSMNAPHIKSEPNKEPSKADCLQMLLNTTDILRKEYIARMEKATETLIKRASSLVSRKKLELEDIERLSTGKDSIISAINSTSVKFDQALERQEKLSQRVEKILETLQTRQNHLSEAERTCQKELNEISATVNSYRNRLDQVQLKYKYQNELKERDDAEGKGESLRKRQSLIAHQTASVMILSFISLFFAPISCEPVCFNETELTNLTLQKCSSWFSGYWESAGKVVIGGMITGGLNSYGVFGGYSETIYLQVHEKINLEYDLESKTWTSDISGTIVTRVDLSKIPVLELSMKNEFPFRSIDTGKIKKASMSNVKFHQSVQSSYNDLQNEGKIIFKPPAGEFELLSYQLNMDIYPIIQVDGEVVTEDTEVWYRIKAKGVVKNFKAYNVSITVPVPHGINSPVLTPSFGSVKHTPENSQIVWNIVQFIAGEEYHLEVFHQDNSVLLEHKIRVNFYIPNLTLSGFQVYSMENFQSKRPVKTSVGYKTEADNYIFKLLPKLSN